jgi:hypothetical protein
VQVPGGGTSHDVSALSSPTDLRAATGLAALAAIGAVFWHAAMAASDPPSGRPQGSSTGIQPGQVTSPEKSRKWPARIFIGVGVIAALLIGVAIGNAGKRLLIEGAAAAHRGRRTAAT